MMHNIKILVLSLLCILSTTLYANTYASKSQLAAGNFVKIQLTTSGVYKLTYEDIQAAGLNPQNLRILGYGGAMLDQDFSKRRIDDLPSVPYYRYTGADGIFNQGDYVLFYAQGITSWTFNGIRFRHNINPYSQYAYYFLSDNAGQQILLNNQPQTIETDNTLPINTFFDYQVHEQELINLIDKSGEKGAGREFYGETLSHNSTKTITFTFKNVVPDSQLRIYTDLAVSSSTQSANVTISYGTQQHSFECKGLKQTDIYTAASTAWDNTLFTAQNLTQHTFRYLYTHQETDRLAYLNYVEATAERYLIMTDNLLKICNPENFDSELDNLYTVQNCNQHTQVWDVTELDSIAAVPYSVNGNVLQFRGANKEKAHRYIIINPESYNAPKPTILGTVGNQNLHALRNIDYVIITHPDFITAAQQLAQKHQQKEQLTTAVVTSEQVYNEFSSGTPDATAYRALMKMLYDEAKRTGGRLPQYLLLLGDGSYDNRKILSTSAQGMLLTYQAKASVNEIEAYATDDYFGFLADESGNYDTTDSMYIAVGRLPINTQEEADNVVNKIISYIDNNNQGQWRQQVCFLADDGDSGLHTRCADSSAEIVRKNNPDFIVNKIYIDAYRQEQNAAGESYPLAKTQLSELLKNGLLFFDYSGHASYNNICNEQMLTASEITQMNNANQGFWMLATCDFAQFDALRQSAAESALLNPQGGAIGLLASCRTVYAEKNRILNDYFCEALFAHDTVYNYLHTIGKAAQQAKNKYCTINKDRNKLPYMLLGDPALKLHFPADYGVRLVHDLDTLNAVSRHTMQGQVVSHNGQPQNNFNGLAYITIYDKLQTVKTLDNDQANIAKKHTDSYYDYSSKIFTGSAYINNGLFNIEFMVPKDIKYNYGEGRVVFYALENNTKEEAIGHNTDFIIGGSGNSQVNDSEGPEIRAYLNNPQFRSGDKTHENPRFYARIQDLNGINTIGNGIGHDLLLIVDDDMMQTYSLNNYYVSDIGQFQTGEVTFPMPTQQEGWHTLTFRAWDLINNSSTISLEYQVVLGLDTQIFSVLTYPNPARIGEIVHFKVQHDRPDDILQTEIYIYDFAGYLVCQIKQQGSADIDWNLSEYAIRQGIYMYKVRIKTEETSFTSKHGKLIIF